MTSKVEMFWGKPDRMEIMSLDSEGELYLQNVIPIGEPNPDFRIFDTPNYIWDWIIDIGKMMGWSSMGTVIEKTIETTNPIISDYEPNTWGDKDLKVFLAEDADDLANSLEKALNYLNEPKSKTNGLVENIIVDEDKLNRLVSHMAVYQLSKFIVFLRKGKFNFVYDD